MKIEISKERPACYQEIYPGVFDIFSHFEFASAIPHVLFAVTTLKENGKPNVNYHSWSCFQGDNGGFFAILAGIYQHTHTYANLKRTGEFCVNFLSLKYMDNLNATIEKNGIEDDEFLVGGFTVERALSVNAPRIKESFLSLECKVNQITDLSHAGTTALVIGEVQNMAVDSEYAGDMQKRYGEDGFMLLAHSPFNHEKNEYNKTMTATLKLQRET